jgi:hypothetical protein
MSSPMIGGDTKASSGDAAPMGGDNASSGDAVSRIVEGEKVESNSRIHMLLSCSSSLIYLPLFSLFLLLVVLCSFLYIADRHHLT